MHILYFHQHFSTPSGATGIRSYEMAKKLISRGHTVTMVCGSYNCANTGLSSPFQKGVRKGTVEGINVVEFELAYSNKDTFIKRFITFIKFALRSMLFTLTAQYDLIFATSTPLTVALPGLMGRWLRRKPFVFEVRDLWPELPKKMGVIKNPLILGLMGILEWATYKSAHGLIGLSPGIQQGILRVGVSPSRVTVIPNGCDISLFAEHNNQWQPEHIKPEDFMAVFTGTHGIANGLHVIIEAAKILKDRGNDQIKFVLVGEGKLKSALKAQALEHKLTNVIFLDAVEKVKISQLLSRADVGLQILANVPAFYYGTSPNKFFDYIAAGLPVLINYPGWLAEKVMEYQCGTVVEPDNPEAIANSLIELNQNRSRLQEIGAGALLLAKSEFDRSNLSAQFVDWLEKWQA